MLVSVSKAERVLEIGTFTGYSALAMAEALPATGRLITCEKDGALSELAKKLIAQAPEQHARRIEVRHGDAHDALDVLAKERLMRVTSHSPAPSLPLCSPCLSRCRLGDAR